MNTTQNTHAKKQLDKWDNLTVFYCKDHFREIYAPIDGIEGLKKILGERNCYRNISLRTVYEYLIGNIIKPFILPNDPDAIFRAIENSAIENAWKVGYRGGNKFNGQSGEIPYNYWEAMIFSLMSIICGVEVKYLPGLKGTPDVELFKKCIQTEENKEVCENCRLSELVCFCHDETSEDMGAK